MHAKRNKYKRGSGAEHSASTWIEKQLKPESGIFMSFFMTLGRIHQSELTHYDPPVQ